ncbi:RHS repeat-associated core domain-containing protein [Thiothrix eikelboomii]|nr:hypothetical protein [Thiothrix eikelboomii]
MIYTAFDDLLQQTGTTENAYRFTGEWYDAGLDQYYLRCVGGTPFKARRI